MKQQCVLTYIDWTFPFKMILDVIPLSLFFTSGGSLAESEGDLNGLICILLKRLGFRASAEFSEVKRRGTLVLSGSNATPVVSERDKLLIWRSQIGSQKSLSTLFQKTEKCRVRKLLFRGQSFLPCQNPLWSRDRSLLA